MTRYIDTQKARRKTPVSISNKNTQIETAENRTTVDEAIDWLSTLPLACKDGTKAKLITDMAIEALQIVRCGECKHKLKEPMYNTDKTWILYQIGDCPIVHKTVADDDFCSYGERREE